jgi:hypothetical protein
MIYLILGIALLILLLGAWYLHISYLKKVYAKIVELHKPKAVAVEKFYENMTVSQGSNFVGLAMDSWMMLFVAIAFFYLLIPGKMPFSYMNQMSDWASSRYGFLVFGIAATLLSALGILILDMLPENHRDLKLTELYSFYSVTKGMKQNIALTIPFLGISILLSAYAGTIYPEQNMIMEYISFAVLFASAVVLVWPVLVGRK